MKWLNLAFKRCFLTSFEFAKITENRAQKWWLEKTRQIIIAIFFGYILTGWKKAFSLIRRSGFLAWIKASQAFATGKYYCHKFLGVNWIERAQWGEALYEVKSLFLKQDDSMKNFLKHRSYSRHKKYFVKIGCVDENSNTTSQLLWLHCEEFDNWFNFCSKKILVQTYYLQ